MAMLKGSSIWGKQLVDLYNSSEIVLNISSWDSDNLGGQNLRLFDVPACGAFLLTEYSEELSEHYRLGVEIETFKTPDELRDKVDYYLKHPVERERIAKLGYERVLKLPNYETRMKEKLDQILSRDTDLSIEVDESLIGGIKLRIDNTYLDASIKSQINNVKLDLMKT